MNRNALRPFSLSSYDPACVEAWVARGMTQTYTYAFGACSLALLNLGKGRYAHLLTPAYVPTGCERVFACVFGVKDGAGLRFIRDPQALERPFGLSEGSPVLFNPSKPFYGEGGEVIQGRPLTLLVPVLKAIALRRAWARNENVLLKEIEGSIPLTALPQPTRTGSTGFYCRPDCC